MISNRDRTAIHEISQIENQSQIRYGIRFLKNWILERIAASFPIPSVRVKLHRMRGINIGKEVYIGYDVIFDRIHPEYITIEDYAEIGDRCIISAHQRGTKTLMDKYPRTVKPVRIGRGAWMAPGCIVIQGVDIGENSVIGTGSVVLWDIPAGTVVMGNPARPMKKLGAGK
ncbi:MAG: acyltransferase [Candidatus Methanoculleus thermohydrogenotrophicum]|jgi:acetyltransferase-like isoleucine patch superfamily enzyme|nr:acyltransferase [Bacillota bacterium]